ncbi:MAG TPA: DUF2092 domain-containing protein [Terriglobia bacterium]|nr:DUF2092 domain-containing protein [Terriglobia bacterium]
MKRIILILTLCAVAAMAQTPTAERNKPSARDAAIDGQAAAALNKMTGFVRGLTIFTVTSEASRDEIVDTDMKIQKNATTDISVRLPSRLHADLHGDDHDLQFIYDGQTLTLFSARQNYYATTPAPPTVSRTLDAIRARHGIQFPLADLIQMTTGENLLQDMTRAGYIGTSRIDGVECDHVAIRQPEVDWQVWIERSDTPVPRKLVITSKSQPTQPQYIAHLTWDFAPSIDNNLFVFTPPPDAVRIKFASRSITGSKQ